MSDGTGLSRAAAEAWIANYIAAVIDRPASAISRTDRFDVVGIDSAEVVIMVGVMEEEFSIELDPNMLFANPSIDGFVGALADAGIVAG
ncbi:acyl carrier protein [Roseomonas sp. SSH11]|uniref:Acyl carrier protein n=1 Tax=Pararoseomonas baculiformis TaxID=2820812 RepID=A0ABS4AFP0_9PROT|nr:acyl carrier protein [Pararoseomonas baculiformis]MBP0445059.1 acyl carrier protein [Pararoseomonas baculiformis]